MGILSRLTGAAPKSNIEAQYAPQVLGEYSPYAMPFQFAYVGRTEAMGVPALARCRNLLAGTIGTIPLELYKKSTGEELGKPLWLDQPSYSQPRSVTIAYTVDSLLFYGQAFWQVVETYQEELAELKRRFNPTTLDDDRAIERWNAGQVRLLAVHPKSAGHGLNLQHGGCHMVFLSLPWSLELYEQTIGRLHRSGQAHAVWCYVMLTNKTIDEKIFAALHDKRAVSDIAMEELK